MALRASIWGEVFRMAMASILSHKLRTFLTLLGVIVGVASVMVVAAGISGAQDFVLTQVSNVLGSNSFILTRYGRFGNVSDEEWQRMLRRNREITLDDLEFLRRYCTDCRPLAAEISGSNTLFAGSRELFGTQIQGVTGNYPLLDTFDVESGRFFSAHEESRGQLVGVIGSEVAQELFPNLDPIGGTVKVGRHPLRVIGVLEKLGTNFGMSRDKTVYMPITTYQRIFGSRRSIRIRGKSDSAEAFARAQDQIRLGMRVRHHLRPNEDDDFGIISADQVNQMVDRAAGYVAAAVIPVTCMSLLVGGIVIMNIMLVSVSERTFEIGIRKALGARRKDVLSQFLMEAFVMSALGGLLGLTTGWLIARAVEYALGFPMEITPAYAALSVLTAGGIGVVFGFFPAYKASQLDPIIAMTSER